MISRRTFIGTTLAGSIGLVTGCRSRPATLRVGYLPISDSLPIFVARRAGYLSRAGLNVELHPLDGGAMIVAALAAGSLDFGISNYVSQILAKDGGVDVELIAGGTIETRANPQHALMVSSGSSLSPPALGGKRIAVNTRKNVNELFMRAFLTKSGVSPDSVAFVEVPFPRMLAALQSGSVDAAGVIEPFVTFGTHSGVARIMSRFTVEVEDQIPLTGWFGTENWMSTHRDTAAQFKRAIQDAIRYISLNQNAARQLIPTFTKLTAQDAAAIPLPTFALETPPRTLSNLIQRTRSAGWLQHPALEQGRYTFAA